MNGFARLDWPPHGGLALANSIAVTLEMVVLLVLLHPLMGGLGGPGMGRAVGKMGLAATGMAVVLVVITPLLPAGPTWLGGLVGILMGGLVYFGLAYAFQVDELRVVLRKVRRKKVSPER